MTWLFFMMCVTIFVLHPFLFLFRRVCVFIFDSEFGDVVATSQNLDVEDAVAFDDSVAAIRRHMQDGTSNENILEASRFGRSRRILVGVASGFCFVCFVRELRFYAARLSDGSFVSACGVARRRRVT